jgi:hypothetical protein
MSTIRATGDGSADPTTKGVVGGWHKMMEGKGETRQQRILREQREASERKAAGIPERPEGYRPGEEPASGEFNLRKMKDHMKKMNESKIAQKVFKGTADQVVLKMVTLFEDGNNADIIKVEEAGFGAYKVTYLPK